MEGRESVWKAIEKAFENERLSDVHALAKGLLLTGLNLKNIALLAQKFAELHLQRKPRDDFKLRTYSLASLFCYLESQETAAVFESLAWIKRNHVLEKEQFQELNSRLKNLDRGPAPSRKKNKKILASFEPDLQFENGHAPLLFSALNSDQLGRLLKTAKPSHYPANTVIFTEGSTPRGFYVIVEGDVDVDSSMGFHRRLGVGDFFGELALLAKIPRSASVTTRSSCHLLEFTDEDFHELLRRFSDLERHIVRFYEFRLFAYRIRSLSFFRDLNDAQLQDLFSLFKCIKVEPGEMLMKQGDPSNSLFFILKGVLHIQKKQECIALRGPGEFIGEIGILRSVSRTADVAGANHGLVLECARDNFNKLVRMYPELNQHLEDLIEKRSA